MHFTVQYVYCTAGSVVLAANLTRFSAQLSNPRTTDLAWSAVNETADRVYDIQRSTDSKTFQTVTSINAQGSETSANYDYSDKIPDSVSGDVYYRLQIHDQGKLSWSAVQKVTVAALTTMATAATTTPTGFNIFPNPATSYINITTGQPAEDWQIDILSSNGNLVQRSTVLQSSTLSVPFTKQLPSGTYFARLTGLRSQKTLSATFIVVNGD